MPIHTWPVDARPPHTGLITYKHRTDIADRLIGDTDVTHNHLTAQNATGQKIVPRFRTAECHGDVRLDGNTANFAGIAINPAWHINRNNRHAGIVYSLHQTGKITLNWPRKPRAKQTINHQIGPDQQCRRKPLDRPFPASRIQGGIPGQLFNIAKQPQPYRPPGIA